ncbi:MAG: hypothetical protein EAZ97_01555 [Bacteroidetes bacterium]|nr:MAG: hypothetical protein EAZ97_01555 [Bacteroidota bacterium]
MKNLLLLVLLAFSFSLKAQDSTQIFPKNNLLFNVGIPLIKYLYPAQYYPSIPSIKNIKSLPGISINYERRIWQKNTWVLYASFLTGLSMQDVNMSPDFGSAWKAGYSINLGINVLHRFKKSPHLLTIGLNYVQSWSSYLEGKRGKVPKDSQFLYENNRIVGIIVGNSPESILFDDTQPYNLSFQGFIADLGYRWQKIGSPYFFSFAISGLFIYSDQLTASLPIKANNNPSLNKDFGGFAFYPNPRFSFGYSF